MVAVDSFIATVLTALLVATWRLGTKVGGLSTSVTVVAGDLQAVDLKATNIGRDVNGIDRRVTTIEEWRRGIMASGRG